MSVRVFGSKILGVSLTSVEVYFKARDVATTLGYERPRYAIDRHVWSKNKFEWCVIQRALNQGSLERVAKRDPLNFHPQTLFLTEPGAYQLIFSSRLPSAEAWVFSEVLPSIRKTGSYTLIDPIEKLQSITLDDLSAYGGDQRKEYKTILKTHANMLKDPAKVEMGRRGGLKCQENRRELADRVKEYERVIKELQGLLKYLKQMD